MKKKLASFSVLVLFAVASMGTSKKKSAEDAGSPVTPATTTTATATIAPTASATGTAKGGKKAAPAVDKKPDPAADYKGFEDANLDGKKAFGKTVLARLRRTSATDVEFTGWSCTDKGSGNLAYLSYTDAQRDLVRAIPTGYTRDDCPRVLFKIKGFASYTKTFKGEVVEILDVAPEAAETPPAGVDYASLDAVLLDGPGKYKGKIVEFEGWRSQTKDKYISVGGCGGLGAGGYLEVKFKPEQREAIKSISQDAGHCTTMRVKMGAPKYSRTFMTGELVEAK